MTGIAEERSKWPSLLWRAMRLAMRQPQSTSELVRLSYDRLAGGYDQAWTTHMRDLTLSMLGDLSVAPGARCIDLACGTGFTSGELARRGGCVTGVDVSAGMLEVARRQHGGACRFIQADAVEFLRAQPSRSADIITCSWGLGYTRPQAFLRETARVLDRGGRVGIVDNSLFSLAGVLWASMLAFSRRPAALAHVMKVRFLPHSLVLATMMRCRGLAVRRRMDGARTYFVPDGRSALARLTQTGAAAGFEFASHEADREEVFDLFGRIMERKYRMPDGIAITHRYLGAVGAKP